MVTIIIHSKSKYFVYFTSSKWYESFYLAYTIIIIQDIFLPTQLLLPTLLLFFDKMPTYTFIPTYMIIRDTRVHDVTSRKVMSRHVMSRNILAIPAPLFVRVPTK